MPDCQQGVCIGHSLDLDCKSSNELSKGLVISLRQAEKRRNSWFRTGARHKNEFKLLHKLGLVDERSCDIGPPSSVKNIVRFCVMAEESARPGPCRVRKLVHVSQWRGHPVGFGLASLESAPRVGFLGNRSSR
ncbi:hypothetical protein BHM03_00062131 [Ensete ventricosum]|nr:hypothetical protein BHM03_00062131 [Ensete ventricosum]